MAKKNNKKDANYNAGIENVNMSSACMDYMKIFAANNNLMRHLPGVYDGLKIGERRIIYTMYLLGLSYKSSYLKVASIVGNTLDFHPHGESPVNDTLVKLAQPWNNTQCLVEGYGNFGSPAGDEAASGRYIEARLSYYAYKCFFEEFSEDIVDMKWNYLGNKKEPEYLPSKYPNVLINNTFGIGYGISTSICTYNLKEVLETTIELIDNPDLDDIVLYPDSPTGAYIVDQGQFPEISKVGKGKFKMRGVIEVDEERNSLHIKSTPLQAFWNSIKVQVFALLNDGKNVLMKDFIDRSDIGVMHYEIVLKKEVDPYTVMHNIYAKTQMEKTMPVTFKLIEDYEDNDYSIRSILLTWLDFRRETKRRLYNHKLTKARERQHILEIMLFILNKDNAERTMSLIKKSESKKEIIEGLMKLYGISSLQANTIAGMTLSAFSKEAYRRYVKEKEEIDAEVIKIDKIVRSAKKIDKIIKEELQEGIELFGEERRSQIINIDNEVKIRDTDHVVVFTNNGLVKKLPDDIKNIGHINQGDYPIEAIECKNTTDLLIFDESGKISKLPVHKLHGCVLNSEGEKLSEHCTIAGKIMTIKSKPTLEELDKVKVPVYYLMITANGIIKKTLASAYTNIKNELLGLIVKDDDKLVSVRLLAGDKDVVVYTNTGFGVRFNSSEIKETSRMTVGVKALPLGDNETVIGMDIISDKDKYLFALTKKGIGKKCTLDNFITMGRNAKPLRIITVDNNDDIELIRTVRGNEKFKVYLTSGIEEIDVEEVIELPRLSKGKKLIGVRKGDTIINIKES